MDTKYTFDDLCRVLDRLLGEGGCPWDREQTHESMRLGLIEECYEVVDAIDTKDSAALCEELGDVLFAIAFHAKLAEREQAFTVSDVIGGITRKMIERHPHVFGGGAQADTSEQVVDNWEKIKAEEKAYSGVLDRLKSVPRAMPSLIRAEKVLKRASDEPYEATAFSAEAEKFLALSKEIPGLSSLDDEQKLQKIGELLLQMANISRILKINADFALTNAIETFINRFEGIDELGESR